jgi:hypothetical protein
MLEARRNLRILKMIRSRSELSVTVLFSGGIGEEEGTGEGCRDEEGKVFEVGAEGGVGMVSVSGNGAGS